MKLSVMTYNVSHFADNRLPEDKIDYKGYARVLTELDANIVGLNEVFGVFYGENRENQLDEIATHSGYEHKYFAKATDLYGDRSYGNALLSKYCFDGITRIVPDPDISELNGEYAETRCVLRADFQVNGKRFTVLVCHFGLNIAEQKNAVKTICQIADAVSTPVILMGDFNVTPESEILRPIRERFNDTDNLLSSDFCYTFPADKPDIKIDYIFYKGNIVPTSAQVVPHVISDHLAVYSEFEL